MNAISLTRGQSALDICADRIARVESTEPWPEMRPLRDAVTKLRYPLEALPDELKQAVDEVQHFTQAPVPLVACSALASLSLACQGLVDIQREQGLRGPVGLFTLVIAESGERKSSSDGFFRKPIDQYEREQVVAAGPDALKHEKQLVAWEARVSGLKDRIRKLSRDGKASDSAERELEELYSSKPVTPVVPRLLYGDVTPEALAYGLAKEWPSGGILSAEAGSVLGGHAMSTESIMRNMSLLNTLWDGVRMKVDRRTSESFVVDGARLTFGLQVQPQTLLAFFEKHGELARGIGFMARFLIAWPESTQGTRFFRSPPKSWSALEQLAGRMCRLLNTPVSLEDGRLVPNLLCLSPNARQVWIDTHDAVESELSSTGELVSVRDVASKAADNVARLAALFHVLRRGPSGEVDAHDVVGAGKIVSWHLQEAKRFFSLAQPTNERSPAEVLEKFLKKKAVELDTRQIPFREVQQFGPTSLRSQAALDEALSILSSHGRLRLHEAGRRRFIDLNPALLEGQE